MLNDTNIINRTKYGMYGSDINLKKKIFILLKRLVFSFSFNYNKFLFDEFEYPSKHFLKLCFRLKQIPAKHSNFFDSSFFGNNSIDLANYDLNERKKIFSYFKKYRTKDQFYNYLLDYIFIDLPTIYFEHFETIRKKITDKSLMKKIIVSQYAIHYNDTFRFYVAETKKNGSKLIIVDHWWNSDKVQSIRKDFLKDYFNVNKNWHNEWANYLNSIKI